MKSQPLDSQQLGSHVQALYSILQKPVMNSRAAWKSGAQSIRNLADCLEAYRKHLVTQNETTQKNQSLLHPVRTIGADATAEFRKATNWDVKQTYYLIDKAVKDAGIMKPVIFDESIHLEAPFKSNLERFRFIEHLQISVPVDIIRFSPGGSVVATLCITQVPKNRLEVMKLTDGIKILQEVRPKLQEFHTRAQKRQFKEKIRNIANIQGSIVDFIYKELTLDASTAAHPITQERIRVISLGNPGLFSDLRHLNPGRPNNKYNVFFEHLENIVEQNSAADDRRHGDAHLSQYISLRDMMSMAEEKCPTGTPIPSKSLVRLQFTPRNPFSHAALSFLSRIKVQYKIQRRQLRATHEDVHYCNAQFKYLKEKAVELRGKCYLMCSDDKAKVAFGEPGCAVSTGVRGKKSIVPVGTILTALDHDMTKGSLTPSVILNCDIPEHAEKSFVRGKVYTAVNDSVFQSASPFRHAAFMAKVLSQEEEHKPILLKMTDGGTDQRNTLEKVRSANIALFRELDLDMLIHVRCAPGQSWINPAERVMSILNLGLQNVSLERKEVEKNVEQSLKSCNSMSDIREKANTNPQVKEGWTESIEPLQSTIRNRFCRLKLKDEQVQVVDPLPDDEVDLIKRHLRELFPQLDLEKLQKAHTKKVESYNRWIEKHCKLTQYVFQIRKCADFDCCGNSILPREELLWLPDPVLENNGNHYKSYADIKNVDTTEADRPSLRGKKETKKTKSKTIQENKNSTGQEQMEVDGAVGEQNEEEQNNSEDTNMEVEFIQVPVADASLCTTQNSRFLCTCCECRKPRVIYSKHRLTDRQQMTLVISLSEYEYTCGSVIVPPSASIYKDVMCRNNLTCQTPIELQYYASGLGSNDLCSFCGEENADVDQELKKQYKTVLPLCQDCRSNGKTPVTQRPYGKN